MVALAGALALLLAAVHLGGGRLRFLHVVPRSRWLSGASGVSVAYVFVHVLPDLAAGERAVRAAVGPVFGFLEHHVYLLALFGMMAFYGLERLVKRSRGATAALSTPGGEGAGGGGDGEPSPGVFWVHVGSFAIYNLLIGYLLIHRERPGPRSLLFFFAAMATHFLVNDFGLREDHRARYDRYGRWLLAGAVVAGWAVGAAVRVHAAAVAMLFALLAGGVILNVLKEELPEERQSNFGAFAAGAAAHAALLIAV